MVTTSYFSFLHNHEIQSMRPHSSSSFDGGGGWVGVKHFFLNPFHPVRGARPNDRVVRRRSEE